MGAYERAAPATKSNGTLEQHAEQAALNAEDDADWRRYDCLLYSHYHLGCLLTDAGGAVGAEAECRAVLSIEPTHVAAY
jgi:hypothetical protein